MGLVKDFRLDEHDPHGDDDGALDDLLKGPKHAEWRQW